MRRPYPKVVSGDEQVCRRRMIMDTTFVEVHMWVSQVYML